MLHVPFKGLAPMTTELLAGRVDLSIAPLPGLIQKQVESGSIRRWPWRARSAPSFSRPCRRSRKAALRVSKPTHSARCLRRSERRPRSSTGCIERWPSAVAKETLVASATRQGIPVALKTPAEISATLPGEVAKWADVIKLANITVE